MAMGGRTKYLLVLLVLVLTIDVFLWIRVNSSLFINKILPPKKVPPQIVVKNYYPGITVSVDYQRMISFLREVGFLQDNQVVDPELLTAYNPKKIVLAFYKEEDLRKQPLIEVFKIQGIDAFGYVVFSSVQEYRLEFYLNPIYLDQKEAGDIRYSLNSLLIKAVVYLTKVAEKKERLGEEERRQIQEESIKFLKKFSIIDVQRS